jgi:isopenicillin N synthase-like dioxygenase
VRSVAPACEDIGFFTVVGHGVPEDVVTHCYEAARAFFDQPIEVKKSVAQRGGASRGYIGFAESTVAHSMGQESPPDLREIYAIGPVDVDRADPYYSSAAAAEYFAPNAWPASPPGFEAALTAYFRAGEKLAATIMRIFAAALDRPEDFFTRYIERSISMVEVLNYPALSAPPLPGQMRVGEHSDYGSLTILFHENKPGNLQVQTRNGEWVDAEAVPGGFVINLGDLWHSGQTIAGYRQYTGSFLHHRSTCTRVGESQYPSSTSRTTMPSLRALTTLHHQNISQRHLKTICTGSCLRPRRDARQLLTRLDHWCASRAGGDTVT